MPHDPQLKACFNSVDEVSFDDIPPEVISNNFDKLNPFIGCPGYATQDVVDFFNRYGRKDITAKALKAEQAVT
jgi:hypothetical protein